MNGAICGPGRYEEVKREPEPERWCFGERKRRTGVHVLLRMPFEDLMATGASGWADPFWVYRCDGCGDDRRAFGG